MTDVKYWIWLQNVLGIGEKTIGVLDAYGTPETVYNTDVETLRRSGLFKRSQLERKTAIPLSISEKAISDCEKNGWKIITPDSKFYPKLLKETADHPLVLYVMGDETVFEAPIHIGVIGTRKPSVYGSDVAHTMTKELVKNGAVIVSGGAQGIDSVAHNTAIEEGGKTILIMGCGFGTYYLMCNEEMRQRVAKNGALVSEFAPYSPVTKVSFIQRNRITAGLCRGVLVVEAGRKSGTLSTAKRSFAYNRDVFAVTGDAKGTSFLGAQELVKSGAKVVFSAQDILSLYGYEIKNKESFYFGTLGGAVFDGIDDFPTGRKDENKTTEEIKLDQRSTERKCEKINKETKKEKEYDLSSLSDTQKIIFEAIKDGCSHLDDIAMKLKIQIRDVLVALTQLEMEGFIECSAGNEYTLI